MKRILLVTLAILLTACLSPSGGAPQTAEPTPTATLTPMLTATEMLSPTPTPPDPDLEYIENFEVAGIKLSSLINSSENAQIDQTGTLRVTKADGTVVTFSKSELVARLHVLDGNVLQIRDINNTVVEFAFDPVERKILDRNDYMSWPIVSAEACINVDRYEVMEKVWEKESLFMLPFDPATTYFPAQGSVYTDWSTYPPKSEMASFPFGLLPQGMDAPMRFVNCIVVDTGVGYPMMVISQQVFNPADGSSSLLRFVMQGGGNIIDELDVRIDQQRTTPNNYLLPAKNISVYNNHPRLSGYKRYLNSKGVPITNGVVGNTTEWVAEWLSTGKVPAKATSQIWMGEFKFWNY